MGWDIIIGKASSGVNWNGTNPRENIEECQGTEPDGLTSLDCTIEKGPKRYPGYVQWSEFMKSCAPLKELRMGFHYYASDGWMFKLNKPRVAKLIDALEIEVATLSPINQDRAKWLIFWTREAVKRYGDDAAIGFW